jgi:hypothetical protein
MSPCLKVRNNGASPLTLLRIPEWFISMSEMSSSDKFSGIAGGSGSGRLTSTQAGITPACGISTVTDVGSGILL